MKPKRKLLPKPWNKRTGTVNRLPQSFRSAIKLFSTRSGSTELPRRRGTTSSQREHKFFSIQQSSPRKGYDGVPHFSRLLREVGPLRPRLRNRQCYRLALRVAARCRRDNDAVLARRRSADRGLRGRFAARGQEQQQR